MARLIGDAMLAALVRAPVARLRRAAGRKAAARGLHWLALRGDAGDPYILARLGLYRDALDAAAGDAEARFGQRLARTGLGKADAASGDLSDDRARRLLARALAPHAPEIAAEMTIGIDRAACLIAAGRSAEAETLVVGEGGAEAALVRAHAAIDRHGFAAARAGWNAAFEVGGIAAPLDASGKPVNLTEFRMRVGAQVADGPLVSVIIPYRDAAATLEHAAHSALGQGWANLELLLVDDGSSDDGPEIAARMAEADARVRPIGNERAAGVYGARNTGIDRATGAFVTFLDADDWSPSERIARQMAALGTRHVAAIANHVRIDEAGRPVAPRVFPIVRPVPITMLIGRDALAAAGPFEERQTGADSEMLGRIEMLNGKRAVARDRAILLVASWRAGSLSKAHEGGLFGAERLAYRAEWMFRHAGLAHAGLGAPLASSGTPGLDRADEREADDRR